MPPTHCQSDPPRRGITGEELTIAQEPGSTSWTPSDPSSYTYNVEVGLAVLQPFSYIQPHWRDILLTFVRIAFGSFISGFAVGVRPKRPGRALASKYPSRSQQRRSGRMVSSETGQGQIRSQRRRTPQEKVGAVIR